MAATRAQIEALLAKLEPSLRKAFRDAIESWRDSFDLTALIAALERGDIAAAVSIANIQPAALNGFLRAHELAFDAAGTLETATLRLNLIFNARHLSGERYLRQFGATFVTGVTDDVKETLRVVLTDSLSRGQGAKAAAREAREFIGIAASQAQAALNLRRKLETDPKVLLSEFEADSYKLRDKRLDGIVRRAARDGKPVAAKDVDKIVEAYKNRAIRWRSENIARTETLGAVNAGKHESYVQAVDSGKVPASAVRKVWNTAHDKRVRDTHRALDKDSVGLDEEFVSPSGARLRYPGDKRAPIGEIINCRCNASYRIDHFANVR